MWSAECAVRSALPISLRICGKRTKSNAPRRQFAFKVYNPGSRAGASLLRNGCDIRTGRGTPRTLGHKDDKTTMVHRHLLNRGGRGRHSPVDRTRQIQSRAEELCGPAGPHKTPEENCLTEGRPLHCKQLPARPPMAVRSLCRPGRILCGSAQSRVRQPW